MKIFLVIANRFAKLTTERGNDSQAKTKNRKILKMKTYIAIINEDKSGAAYGVGENEEIARNMAVESGFDREDGIAIQITEESYQAILAGNPDAVTEVE